jgi:glycosyltransferase involved in cell wall biosynthesis
MGKLALCFVDKVFTASSKSFPVVTAKKVVVGHAVMVPLLWQQHAPTGVPIILFVGRITPVKKVEVVIEVARILRERKIPCMVRIVGDTPDATYNAKILHLIQQHSLKDTVTMVGPKIESALGEEYLHATVSINPSETGSIDKVVLNAMSYGIPVVALERTYGEILNPYHLAVSTQDPVDYADRIEEIISLGTERSVLSLKLREEVTSRHALDTLTQRIFDI